MQQDLKPQPIQLSVFLSLCFLICKTGKWGEDSTQLAFLQ